MPQPEFPQSAEADLTATGLAPANLAPADLAPANLAPRMEAVQPSPDPSGQQVQPRCIHFGTCGGCQYQHLPYGEQLALKADRLRTLLQGAGLAHPAPAPHIVPSPDSYAYRNRIRLRVRTLECTPRLGYSVRGTQEFLPVTMCPIAAPLLQRALDMLNASAAPLLQPWLQAASEVELFTNADQTRLQLSLLCPTRITPPPPSFAAAVQALQRALPELSGAGAHRFDPHSGRTLAALAQWGDVGLAYQVPSDGTPETYWITRGGFFQVNRVLLPTLVDLVCRGRSGTLAWDLFAGVGLFSRPLARQFAAVTAVEANPTAAADLARTLAKLGKQHRAVQSTTLDFLRAATLQRERPDLVVLDPPRAGAGEEVCSLLNRFAPPALVYLSCDPVTLARDLAVLSPQYRIETLQLIDLFPQTLHVETLAILRRS